MAPAFRIRSLRDGRSLPRATLPPAGIGLPRAEARSAPVEEMFDKLRFRPATGITDKLGKTVMKTRCHRRFLLMKEMPG